MATFWAISTGRCLVPASKASAIEMDRLPRGPAIRVDAVQPRNGKHHRLIWALYSYVANALNDGPTSRHWTAEDVSTHVKIATGHVMPISVAGQVYHMPKSISYAAMAQEDFAIFADRAMQYIRDDLCPWLMESEHAPEIMQIVMEYGGNRRERDAKKECDR